MRHSLITIHEYRRSLFEGGSVRHNHRDARSQSWLPELFSEGMLGTLALKRGFRVRIWGQKPRLTNAYLKLGGEIDRIKTSTCSILQCVRRGIPPIVLIPSAREVYEHEIEEVGHYVVVTGIDATCRPRIADPQYVHSPSQQYWNKWSSSLIEIMPRQ